MKLYFDDVGFDGQLQRTVGKCDTGMANVGECVYIASLITEGDRDSWYAAWSGFADGLVRQADDAFANGHRVSGRDCSLRAAEYYRQSFFWHRDDLDGKELTTAYAASVKAFRTALPLLDVTAHVLEGDTPGYLYVPDGDGPFPTILHIGGYDGIAEELYASAYTVVDRGYAFATLDGPGTGRPVRPPRADASRLGAHRPRDGRPDADATRGRPAAHRAGRPVVRWPDRTTGRVGRAAPGGDGRRPRPVRPRCGYRQTTR